jgi:hypothetical protein
MVLFPAGQRVYLLSEADVPAVGSTEVHPIQRALKKGTAFRSQAYGTQRFWAVKASRFDDIGTWRCKVVSLTHWPSLPPDVSWYSCLRGWVNPGHIKLSDATDKIPSDTTRDRSRDLPTSSVVHSKSTRGVLTLGKASEAWADHSPPSTAQVTNVESYTFTPHMPSWHAQGHLP